MEEKPLISVLLPVQNGQQWLKEALESVLVQTHQHLEVIAIDDKSTDKSRTVLNKMRKLDNRIRVYRNVKRYGIALTLNRALKKAKGSYVAFIDQATLLDPLCLEKSLEILMTPKTVAVTTQCTTIDEHDTLLYARNVSGTQPFMGELMHCHMMVAHKVQLPKDLLYFRQKPEPFLYTDVFAKIPTFGDVVSIPSFLHTHKLPSDSTLGRARVFITMVKLWVKFFTKPEFRPSLRAIFFPPMTLR